MTEPLRASTDLVTMRERALELSLSALQPNDTATEIVARAMAFTHFMKVGDGGSPKGEATE